MNNKNHKYYPLRSLLPDLPLFLKGISNREIKLHIKIISIAAIMITLSSCVNLFSPQIKGSDLKNYVVSGQVTTGAQTQTVNVSTTSPISNPTYEPVTGCKVTIQDNENHNFSMISLGDGEYSTMVDPKYLVPGHVFRVSVITPDGDSIVSDYDTLQQVPTVDSIYYLRKKEESSITGPTQGLQFYIDLKGTNADSRYYRWIIYETWEYHAMYPLEFYWTGKMNQIWPPDSSRYTCWDTRKIPEIFTLSTANLSQNTYNGLPLQYVDNTTQKLFSGGYSMLVEQLALSKTAYDYWYKLQTNSTQGGGLYEKQPLTIRGNLHDITHPDKEVLGFFSSESASYKRIFIRNVPGLPENYSIPCGADSLRNGFSSIPAGLYPAPIKASANGSEPLRWRLTWICINCLLRGGDTIKPSFWPN